MFHVGQKVVCVVDGIDWHGRDMLVKKGQIYTISKILSLGGVLLQELSPAPWKGWHQRLFRPVVEPKKKTSIEVFQKILDEVNELVEV